MSWKEISPERRHALIRMLSVDAQAFLATAEGMIRPSGKKYFEDMGRTYSAAAEALRQLADPDS